MLKSRKRGITATKKEWKESVDLFRFRNAVYSYMMDSDTQVCDFHSTVFWGYFIYELGRNK